MRNMGSGPGQDGIDVDPMRSQERTFSLTFVYLDVEQLLGEKFLM